MEAIGMPGQAGQVRLELLGGFQLSVGGMTVPLASSVQRLVAFLALQTHALRRAHVAGRLWPDVTDARSTGNLRSALWRLGRSRLAIVRATQTHLALAESVAVDTREVVATSRRLLSDESSCAEEDLNPARLTGELLPDWYEEEWVVVERERMRQLCLHALEGACQRLAALGRYAEAVEAGLWAVRGEPLRESAHRLLIKVHLAEGNEGEALRQYRWYSALVHEELGLAPSGSMAALIGALLNGRGI